MRSLAAGVSGPGYQAHQVLLLAVKGSHADKYLDSVIIFCSRGLNSRNEV